MKLVSITHWDILRFPQEDKYFVRYLGKFTSILKIHITYSTLLLSILATFMEVEINSVPFKVGTYC